MTDYCHSIIDAIHNKTLTVAARAAEFIDKTLLDKEVEKIEIARGSILANMMRADTPRHLRFPATHWLPLPPAPGKTLGEGVETTLASETGA